MGEEDCELPRCGTAVLRPTAPQGDARYGLLISGACGDHQRLFPNIVGAI